MHKINDTTAALARLTDEGLFEQLAMAVLREANPLYATLAHPGLNAEGKTIKGPLDGISFVPGTNPPHVLTVHHTTTPRAKLHQKWLQPLPRTGRRASSAIGDVVKTAAIIAAERQRTPALQATLVLTTNQEPREDVVRDVHAAGMVHGITIDIWSRSRLAHFLDHDPQGQWIRRAYLGIDQERLSRSLLHELSRASLQRHAPPDSSEAWVDHDLDKALAGAAGRNITFVVAHSGSGKTVACYRRLSEHIARGAFGLIIPHEIVAATANIDQALEATLRQLSPALASDCGVQARQLGSAVAPLLLLVEDVNRSGKAALLVEKIFRWKESSSSGGGTTPAAWTVLCPVWPGVLTGLEPQTRKLVDAESVRGGGFSPSAARTAVQRRAELKGSSFSAMDADAIAAALGNDPLLIALHDATSTVKAHDVIGDFVQATITRVALLRGEYIAADYQNALLAVAHAMLAHRDIDPSWNAATAWLGSGSEALAMLRHLVHDARLVRLVGPASDERLAFRHDRVRDYLSATAACGILQDPDANREIISDPFLAEVMGAALARSPANDDLIARIGVLNPLALFHAFRHEKARTTPYRLPLLAAIDLWLSDPGTHTRANRYARWYALSALSEIDDADVPSIVKRFEDQRNWSARQARFRNGDFSAGLELCYAIGPGSRASWRDRQIEHARSRFGDAMIRWLDATLRDPQIEAHHRIGALRLAGHLGDRSLALAIEASWHFDPQRPAHLPAYLWAAAQCCSDDPARFLKPICDAWAALSDERQDSGSSPRNSLAAFEVRQGFELAPPIAALKYFTDRAETEELRWPITYMLHGVDHPDAQSFIVHEIAAKDRTTQGKSSFFAGQLTRQWDRRYGYHRVMSGETRRALLDMWQANAADHYLRAAAFAVWAVGEGADDLSILRQIELADPLWDSALRHRLYRGDHLAIPSLLDKLRTERDRHWWWHARHVWSDALTAALGDALAERGAAQEPSTWAGQYDQDYILSERLMILPTEVAEPLLVQHWNHLRYSPYYVQTALYRAAPALLRLADEAIRAAPVPAKMLEHVDQHFGHRVSDGRGVTRQEQMEALVPYLDILGETNVARFWEMCNERGWFELRRRHLDTYLTKGREAEYLSREGSFAALDRIAADERHPFIDMWVDRFLKTGASHEELIALFGAWLSDRRTIQALSVTSDALIHFGRRADLSILSPDQVDDSPEANAIVADTSFAVQRRSLE